MPDFIVELTPAERLLMTQFQRAARWCGLLAMTCGIVMMALWILRRPPALGLAGMWLMKPNTALCLALGGAALAVGPGVERGSRVRWCQVLALAAGLIAALTSIEHVAGLNLHLNALWAGRSGEMSPGRMLPQTALAFVLASVSLAVAHRRDRLATAAGDLAVVGLGVLLQSVMAGYFFLGADPTGTGAAARMTPQSLVALTVLWSGMVYARADRGVYRILSGEGRGSQLIRFMLPPAIGVPVLLAVTRFWAEAAGFHGGPSGLSVFGTLQSIVRVAVIVGLGHLLNRLEAARREEQTRREEAERLVAMCAWTRQVRWNDEWMSVDEFLERRFGLEVTHGISDEALNEQLLALDLAGDLDRPVA